jgi:peptidoglycan hydrolase-like protein with peptidoglycan-binding domain
MESVMRKTTLMLFASAALALSGALPAMAQNTPANQPPQAQNPAQPQGQNQQASNQSIPSSQLGRRGVRQVQLALIKTGRRVGRPDGVMGPKTRQALQSYQKSKGMPASGKINQQTLSDLGVQVAQGRQRSKQGNRTLLNQGNKTLLNQNQNTPGGNASPGTNQ